MAQDEVGVKISADDQSLQQGLSRAGSGVRKFGDEAERQARATQKAWDAAGKAVERQALALAAGLAAGAAASARHAAVVEANLRNVNTMAHLTEEGFSRLTDSVIRMSDELAGTKGPKELSESLYEVYSAGLKGEKALAVVENAAKAADAGLTSTKVSAGVLTTAMIAYNAKAEDAGRISDILFRTVDRGKVSFEQLATSLGPALTKAAAFNVSIEEVGASMALLSQTMPAAEAATALERLITQMAAPTEESAKKMAELGVQFGKGAIEAKGFIGVLEDVIEASDGNDLVLRKMLSSSEAFQAALALTSNKSATYRDNLKAMENAHGAMDAALQEQLKSAEKAWGVFVKQVEIGAVTLGREMLPLITSALHEATEGIKDLRNAWESNWMGMKDATALAAESITQSIRGIRYVGQGLSSGFETVRGALESWGLVQPERDPRMLGMGLSDNPPPEYRGPWVQGEMTRFDEVERREADKRATQAEKERKQREEWEKLRRSALGLDKAESKKTQVTEQDLRAAMVKHARDLVGLPTEDVRRAMGNVGDASNQCANTMRLISKRAGMAFPADFNPWDKGALAPGEGVGPAHADSLFGSKVGKFSQTGQVGDLVFFEQSGRPGVVGHVGMVSGPGMMIDASAKNQKVMERSIDSTGLKRLGFVSPHLYEKGTLDADPGKAFFDQLRQSREKFNEFMGQFTSDVDRELAELDKAFKEALPGAQTAQERADLTGVYQSRRTALEAERGSFEGSMLGLVDYAQSPIGQHEMRSERIATTAQDYAHQRAMIEAMAETDRQEIAAKRAAERQAAQERLAELQTQLQFENLAHETKRALMVEQRQIQTQLHTEQVQAADERTQREMADMEWRTQMGLLDLEQKALWLQQELLQFTGTQEMKRQLLLELHNTQMQLQQEQFAAADQLFASFEQSFQGMLTQTLSGQQNFNQTFQSLWKSVANAIIAELVKMIAKALMLQTIMRGIFGFFGGIFGIGASTVGATSSVGDTILGAAGSLHTGGLVLPGGSLRKFHSGGVVGMDLAADEVLAVLQTGEMVLSRDHVAMAQAAAANREDMPSPSPSIQQSNTIYLASQADPREIAREIGRDTTYRMQGV